VPQLDEHGQFGQVFFVAAKPVPRHFGGFGMGGGV
jgi:hypothetical protein